MRLTQESARWFQRYVRPLGIEGPASSPTSFLDFILGIAREEIPRKPFKRTLPHIFLVSLSQAKVLIQVNITVSCCKAHTQESVCYCRRFPGSVVVRGPPNQYQVVDDTLDKVIGEWSPFISEEAS